jgi:hypothetical protein
MNIASELTISLPRYLCITMNDGDIPRTLAHYAVAKDFISWLLNTKRLYIRDRSDHLDRPSSNAMVKYRKNNEMLTWDLIRHAVAKLKNVEHFDIDRWCGDVDLDFVFKWLDFPKLKSLEIMKARLSADVVLENEVRIWLVVGFNARGLSAKVSPRADLISRVEATYCIVYTSHYSYAPSTIRSHSTAHSMACRTDPLHLRSLLSRPSSA